ncbi:MAG TPA: hypothetical protein VFJ16_28155 [Longimicrobium sp.]|nr:hypothetical protein [Longimicrobium sp.]
MKNPARPRRSRGGKDPLDLRSIFRKRTEALVQRLSEQASEDALAAALAAPSDFGGLARLLSETAALGVALDTVDPLAEAVARGVESKQALLRDAGGGWSAARAAAHLGITRQAVDKRRRAGKLLALQSGTGDHLYPVCQFTEHGVLGGIDRVLAAFPPSGGWTRLDVLLTPAEEIGGISPLEALRHGDVDAAILAASMFGEQG